MQIRNNNKSIQIGLVFSLLLLSILFQKQTLAQEQHDDYYDTDFKAYITEIKLPDVNLRDSQDNEHKLRTLMQNKIVLIDFIFTSCTTICPVMSSIMSNTAERMAHRMGNDVILISISVDPTVDTPSKLLEHSKKFDATPNWYWITGAPSEINKTLKAFGLPVNNQPETHPPVVLVSNKAQTHWYRWVGIPKPETLIKAINVFSNKENL